MVEVLIALALPYTVAALNGVATQTTVKSWYPTLDRPPFRPPNWLFAPAWTVFYTLMGIASYIVYSTGGPASDLALGLYLAQLTLNALWSPVFFWQKSITGGLIVMSGLVIIAAVTNIYFFEISHLAGWLFFPYIIWLVYAWTLNAYIFTHNNPTEAT